MHIRSLGQWVQRLPSSHVDCLLDRGLAGLDQTSPFLACLFSGVAQGMSLSNSEVNQKSGSLPQFVPSTWNSDAHCLFSWRFHFPSIAIYPIAEGSSTNLSNPFKKSQPVVWTVLGLPYTQPEHFHMKFRPQEHLVLTKTWRLDPVPSVLRCRHNFVLSDTVNKTGRCDNYPDQKVTRWKEDWMGWQQGPEQEFSKHHMY